MKGIDNKYIENAISTLSSTIGVKDRADDQKLISLVHSNKVKECIQEIAQYLRLPVKINLSYVSRDYKKDIINNFSSTNLVKTDWRGKGNEGITAQVSIPSGLPLYGTATMNNFPISVRISENCTDRATIFIAVMAHELSHIVLHSLWHQEKDNEIYTDLTAMMMGFADIIKRGRKNIEDETYNRVTTTYGYLSDEQFNFAFNRINNVLESRVNLKKELLKKIILYKNLISSYNKLLIKFKNYLHCIGGKRNQNFFKEDVHKILYFHQPFFTDELMLTLKINQKKEKKLGESTENINHYTENTVNLLKNNNTQLDILITTLKTNCVSLNENVSILGKYISWMQKLICFFIINNSE